MVAIRPRSRKLRHIPGRPSGQLGTKFGSETAKRAMRGYDAIFDCAVGCRPSRALRAGGSGLLRNGMDIKIPATMSRSSKRYLKFSSHRHNIFLHNFSSARIDHTQPLKVAIFHPESLGSSKLGHGRTNAERPNTIPHMGFKHFSGLGGSGSRNYAKTENCENHCLEC